MTKGLLETIQENRNANKELLISLILDQASENIEKTLPRQIQLKGQIHTFDRILDTHNFLEDYIETDQEAHSEEENKNEL